MTNTAAPHYFTNEIPRPRYLENLFELRELLVPLRDFEIHKSSESPGVGASEVEFFLFSWWAFVINYIDDLLTFGSRQKKLAALKAEVLPQFPESQVCPRCWLVRRLP